MRKSFIAGNWKMNTTIDQAKELANSLALSTTTDVDVAVIPPSVYLSAVSDALHGSNVLLGAQNMHPEQSGAYTGELSGGMLKDVGCHYVLCGHSERRTLFGESSEWVGVKVAAAFDAGLLPILCIGETLEERDAGQVAEVLVHQLDRGLNKLSGHQVSQVTVAYEPVWAIGTGRTASPEQAQDAHRMIRSRLSQAFGADIAESVRIQYGGSVKPHNASDLLSQPDIDGALVGGASLTAESFAAIITAAFSS
jgi:triosephosphate isomerase (TIM)